MRRRAGWPPPGGVRRPSGSAPIARRPGGGAAAGPGKRRRGNLAATLLLHPERPASECAQLSFVTALAVADTVAGLAPNAETKVKWPNDVLVDGRKISGILLESASGVGPAPAWLAIGIGINLAYHPEGTETPATSIAALTGKAPSPHDTLCLLAWAFAKWYDLWCAQGFSPIRDGWLARAAKLGERIRARLSHEEIFGVFEGIDETGALILRESGGKTRLIAAGDVFFGA